MNDSATLAAPRTTTTGLSNETTGMLLGLVGVIIFSLTLPFTRIAVAELDPAFIAFGRAVVAALLAGVWLRWNGASWPPRAALLPLAVVSGGCIIGFPWLSSIAMRTLPAAHGAVMAGLLPLATAVCSALRGHEKPSLGFWLMALTGSSLVIGFALHKSGGSFHPADLAMLGAVLLAGAGYAEGGRLAQSMGGQQVISWALVLSLPLLLPLTLYLCWAHAGEFGAVGARSWCAFAYVSALSMFIGFFFWYRGLAKGGIARVGQVQLVQPFLTQLGAWVLLGEALEWSNFLFAAAVIAVVFVGRRMQVRR